MSFKTSVFLSVSILVFSVFVSSTQAQTIDAADLVKRMQALTVQMETLQKEFVTLTVQLTAAPAGVVLGESTVAKPPTAPVFTMDLSNGATNDDIKKIQVLLATDPEIYPYGVASGFFGPKTEEAIKNLQSRFGYNPVGVIGPATRALLEGYLRAYPNGNYPEGILSTKPTVASGSTSSEADTILARLQAQLAKLTGSDNQNDKDTKKTESPKSKLPNNPAKSIEISYSDKSAKVKIKYQNNDKYDDESFVVKATNLDGVVKELKFLTFLSEDEIRDVATEAKGGSSGGDKSEAEDIIEEAKDVLDDVEDEIDEADEDGEDVDYAEELFEEAEDLLDEAEDAFDDKDYDKAIDLAKEAIELVEEAEDAIGEEGRDASDIDSIEVEITGRNSAEVTVEYENGDDESFDLNEDDREDLIADIADELDLDEDDVEDLVEFDYGDVESIDVEIDDGIAEVKIKFETGVRATFDLDEDDEDRIIRKISDLYGIDEDDVEDVIDFD
jgi:peptidoglycan hydrolase-like protein with peptidoglycan-binding domain